MNKTIKLCKSELLILIFISISATYFSGILRYILIAMATVIYFIIKNKTVLSISKTDRTYFYLILPPLFYVILGVITSITHHSLNSYTFRYCIFILLPFATALILVMSTGNTYRLITAQFCVHAVIYIIRMCTIFLKSGFRMDLLESSQAFLFSLYSIYFLVNKKYKLLLFTVPFILLTNKRISFAGLALVLVLYMIITKFNKNYQKIIKLSFVAAAIIVIFYVWSIYSNTLTNLYARFNIMDMGRLKLYNIFKATSEFSLFYFGDGLGSVMNKLAIIRYPITNLHSDWLMCYMEIGLLGLLIYLLLYYKIFKKFGNKNYMTLYLAIIYLFVIYLTDNVMIYINILIGFYTITLSTIKVHIKNPLDEKTPTVPHKIKGDDI